MSPRGYIAIAICLAVLGGIALAGALSGVGLAWLFAAVLLTASTLMALIGVIGEGVRIGMRAAADEDRSALRRAQELV